MGFVSGTTHADPFIDDSPYSGCPIPIEKHIPTTPVPEPKAQKHRKRLSITDMVTIDWVTSESGEEHFGMSGLTSSEFEAKTGVKPNTDAAAMLDENGSSRNRLRRSRRIAHQ